MPDLLIPIAGSLVPLNFPDAELAATIALQIAGRAGLASPAFTGVPTAPTAAPGTNTTQISTTAFVQAAISALIDASPGALDTLNELAAALGGDANFAATMTTALAGKQPLDADLTALAALTTTSFGRALLELANAAALRTAAGLVIGTDVQAYHATLAALAGLTLAQGDILYRDGSGLQRLAAGTAGQRLKTGGAGANPSWANSDVEILQQSAVQVSHTGDTSEFTLASYTLPGGKMGANDRIEIAAGFTFTSSANAKTLRIKFGSATYRAFAPTATTQLDALTWIANRNAANSQVGPPNGQIVINQAITANMVTSAEDTTANVTIAITGQNANSGDTVRLEGYTIKLVRAPS